MRKGVLALFSLLTATAATHGTECPSPAEAQALINRVVRTPFTVKEVKPFKPDDIKTVLGKYSA